MHIFKLKFRSALHIDSRGSGEPDTADEFIRSDTLSAALCQSWAMIFPETDGAFFFEPPFRISSAFPYIGSTLLFPVPAWNVWATSDIEHRKKIKNIRWLSQGLLERILNGELLCLEEVPQMECGVAVTGEEMQLNPDLGDSIEFWKVVERQRVTVDRLYLPREGGLFFFSLQFFSGSAGLYFIVDATEENLAKLERALAYLGDSGLGADRNSGLGHFEHRRGEEFKVRLPQEPNGWFTLSLFNPAPEEELSKLIASTAYGLITRSGWISNTTVGRPPVRTFSEGSYFSHEPKGRVLEMLDQGTREHFALPVEHSAPRDFRPVCLPCAQPPRLKEDGI